MSLSQGTRLGPFEAPAPRGHLFIVEGLE
jgi:hypothetical protein